MSTNTPWPAKVAREIRRQKLKEAGFALLLLAAVLAVLLGAFMLSGCMAHSEWYPRPGSSYADVVKVMGRPADEINEHEARWLLHGALEAYAEFDRPIWWRGVIVMEGEKVRARYEFEQVKLVYFEWNGSAYNAMEPKP